MKFGIMAPYQLGPVESGDYARSFARRVEELGIGVGFYPPGVDLEQLAELRRIVREKARAHGRDPAAIELTCAGTAQVEAAARYHHLGVDRMVIFPLRGDLAELRRSLEAFSRDAIQKFA